MPQRQFATPVLVCDGKADPLTRIALTDRTPAEGWLQDLLYKNPSLLPVNELEAEFDGLVSVARELATPAGPVDLVFVNSLGFITIAETKLCRNPEARRTVVAQILDYAKEVSRWSYDEFISAVRKARGSTVADPLLELFKDDADFDKGQFIDRVSRNLRRGRFLLLIVGDGIRESVERITEFLQQAPQLGFTLGLVELAVFRMDAFHEGAMLVQPRVVARTREITRAIIEVRGDLKPGDVTIRVPEGSSGRPSGGRIAQEDYLEQLEQEAGPEVVQFMHTIMVQASKRSLDVQWKTNGFALEYTDESSGERFPLVWFYPQTMSVSWKKSRLDYWRSLGISEKVWIDLADRIAAIVPGAKRREFNSERGNETVLVSINNRGPKSSGIPLANVTGKEEALFAAIDIAVASLQKSLANPDT